MTILNDIRYYIRTFVKGIKNLIRWFPIIWKDRDWDHHFIFEILKFKLKNQAEYIGKKGNHISAKRDAERMMLCVRLLERVQTEYYGLEYQDYNKIDLEFIDSKTHPGKYEMKFTEISENFDEYFKKYPLIYKKVFEPGMKKSQIAFRMALINEERANKLLFKILEGNIRKWWD